jgi:hypothetical protein
VRGNGVDQASHNLTLATCNTFGELDQSVQTCCTPTHLAGMLTLNKLLHSKLVTFIVLKIYSRGDHSVTVLSLKFGILKSRIHYCQQRAP